MKARIALIVLAAGCLSLFAVALTIHRRAAGREADRLSAQPHLERARDYLARADRHARADGANVRAFADEALVSATAAAELLPGDDEPHRLRARALELLYAYAEADEAYGRALAARESAPSRFGRGMLRFRMLVRARLLEPKASSDAAILDLRRQTSMSGDLKSNLTASSAIAFLLGDTEQVGPLARSAHGLDETDGTALLVVGLAQLERSQPGEALADLERACRLYPYGAEAQACRGVALWRLGRRGDAVEALSNALRLDPAFLEALCLRGVVFHEDGQPDEARRDFDAVLKIRPSLKSEIDRLTRK